MSGFCLISPPVVAATLPASWWTSPSPTSSSATSTMASMTTIASPTLTSATLSSTPSASILITVVLPAEPTTMSATAPAATAIVATMVKTHCLKPARQFLVALHDQLHQVFGEVSILVIEEGGGKTKVAHSTSTSNSVDILFHVTRHVKVDDVFHIWDVKTSRCHCSCNNDWGLAHLEPAESLFSFSLRAVTVDTCNREALPVKELVQTIGSFLGFNKDQCPAGLSVKVLCSEARGVHEVEQE